MKYEKSCGCILFKEIREEYFVLLVHHNLGHWGIPKGHVENGETEEETAVREVYEETGVRTAVVPGFREMITYSPKSNVVKDVIFFIGEIKGGSVTPQLSEVDEVAWINTDESLRLITRKNERNLLEHAIKYYKTNIRK